MDSCALDMLNDVVTAVDEGFSYDGIVSVPDTGLEDVRYRSGLTDSLRNSMHQASAVISRGTARVFPGKPKQRHFHFNPDFSLSSQDLPRKMRMFDLARAETDEQTLALRKTELRTARGLVDEDDVCGCCPGLVIPSSARNRLHKKTEEEWEVVTVTPVNVNQGGLPRENSEGGREDIQPHFNVVHEVPAKEKSEGCGQLSDVNLAEEERENEALSPSTVVPERLPRLKEHEEEGVAPPLTVDPGPERLPRKKNGEDHSS